MGATVRPNLMVTSALFELTADQRQNYRMSKGRRETCPACGATIILALPPGGKGKRTMQCVDCDRPDPLKSDAAKGWLTSELQPPN
jgi:hypothetical protein